MKVHITIATKTLFLATMLVVSLLLSSFITMKRLSRYLPESGACMIFGILIGVVFIAVDQTNLESALQFSPEMFYFILLPPIIFDAGFSMKKRNFFMNMIPILLYAILGTIISAFVVGYILYGLAVAGYLESIDSSSPIEALTFGALISATDPVATLSILGSPGTSVEPQLYSIIFGESVLNDAVGIVLFNTFSGFLGKSSFQSHHAFQALGEFFGVSAGSVLIGLGLGLFSAAFFKKGQFGKHENGHIEVAFLCLFAYSSYTIAEIAQMSGVMSLFLTGVVMQHYTWYSMSDEGKTSAHTFFKTLAVISETFVFVYLGINMSTSTVDSDFKWDGNLLVTAFTACLVARACNIVPLTFLANIGRKRKVNARMQTLMWFAGLRGAVAFSLALNVTSDNRKYIVTTTLFIAISTTLVFGCLTAPLVKALGLAVEETMEESLATTKYMDGSAFGSVQNGEEYQKEKMFLNNNAGGQKEFGRVHRLWRKFDEKFMKGIFGGRPREYQEIE